MDTYYVYILQCSDNSFYTGSTNNIERRFNEHQSTTKGAKYTKCRRPVTLVYTEKYKSRSEAMLRELEIKSFSRLKKINLISTTKPDITVTGGMGGL